MRPLQTRARELAPPAGAPRARRRAPTATRAGVAAPGDLVLVAGATGGVGQLVTAKLLDRGYRVRALTRDPAKAAALFGEVANLECVAGDTRTPATLASAVAGVAAVACCTGTTAFPSKRWFGGNGPRATDDEGVRNLVAAAKGATPGVKRFVLVSSAGVDRSDKPPYSILNLFGVLASKKAGEDCLLASGVPATLLRPGRLTDGPYTSYDLNTLLRATADDRRGVVAARGDTLDGQTSRVAVAEAVVQCLALACAEGAALSLESTPGTAGPGEDAEAWERLLCG